MPGGLSLQLLLSLLLFGVALLLRALSSNRVVRSRVRLTFGLTVAVVAIEAMLRYGAVPPAMRASLLSIERLVFALALIHTLVLVLVNPLRADRIPERFPTIVQDAVVIGLFLVVATFVLDEKFLTTSAVGAVVIGFALQDTLGNMFSGLAIQIEKPFTVGQWIASGAWEGAVVEVTWRATKIRTRQGNLIVVPNSEVAKQAITNYSEPAAPTRIQVEVGASYANPPNQVKEALLEVARAEPLVLASPAPRVELVTFGGSAITYRVLVWIRELPSDDLVKDRLHTGIYYAFQRQHIEIPYPIQVEYQRAERIEGEDERARRLQALIDRVELFAPLSAGARERLAQLARERTYGAGETIVREDAAGDSAFIVGAGRVRVTIGHDAYEVATIEEGGYFGEMSLLTGDPRTATVSAACDCRVAEITAGDFRDIVLGEPAVLDAITAEVARRRTELARARSAVQPVAAEPASTLLARVRRFLLKPSVRL